MRIVVIAVLFLLGGATAMVAATGSASGLDCPGGPTTIGNTTWGTACDDTIVVPPRVETVHGGGGDDTILPAPIAAGAPCTGECLHLGVGSQTFDGGPGNDVVFGERGNDLLNGGEGDDSLYGGIGDDQLRGGSGNDLLSGGFGADSIDGEAGDDFVRGDATLDRIADSGGNGGVDTLSYATGVTPGFLDNPNQGYPDFSVEYPGFPELGGERGVYIDLEAGGASIADNGVAPDGGGVDGSVDPENEDLQGTDFERFIGTPFSDFIVGSSNGEAIYGGGGADVILGEGGDDMLHGGADGDHLDGGTGQDAADGGAGSDSCEGYDPSTPNPCETSGKAVAPREASKAAVGIMAQDGDPAGLYVAGSDVNDTVAATYSESSTEVTFEIAAGAFDSGGNAAGGCSLPAAGKVVCDLSEAPDSIVLAGMSGNDALSVAGFPDSTTVVALGGEGEDSLTGGNVNEDVLADGPGDDQLAAFGGDDALLNNDGKDTLDAGAGSDLLLSDSICDDDLLNGGAGDYRDNASWTKLKEPVAARLDPAVAGRPLSGEPSCAGGGALDHFQTIEDLEGSANDDLFYGNAENNQLLGHKGSDSYLAAAGKDTILANSADSDLVIDCGSDNDIAFVDIPTEKYVDPVPVGCETVYEAEPNSFKPPGTPTGPASPPAEATSASRPPASRIRRDQTPPRSRLLRRPPKIVFMPRRRRVVSFAFASNESGATFRCKLDRDRFRPCRSPRAYRLRSGRHAFSVFAIDRAGNRDRSPVLFSFRIRRR